MQNTLPIKVDGFELEQKKVKKMYRDVALSLQGQLSF